MVGEEMNKETDKLIIVVIENFCTVLSTIKDSVSESRTIGGLYPPKQAGQYASQPKTYPLSYIHVWM